MMNDFERQQCRDFKKRMDMAKTPEGMAAIKIARQRQREQGERERILKRYAMNQPQTGSQKAEQKETATDHILKFYK